MTRITFFSLKGGTGKTTLSYSLGWLLAEAGNSVLMIDLDPQGHLTQSFQGKPQAGQTSLYQALIEDQPLTAAVVPTLHSKISLIPATTEHFDLNTALFNKPWREWKLKDALSAIYPFPYDLVIMDAGANLNLITYNALFAAQTLIIPAIPDLYSFLSLKSLFEYLEKLEKDYKYHFKAVWVLLNKLNNHRPLDRENREALKKFYHSFLLPVMIREDPKFSQALLQQEPVSVFAPQSTASRDLKKLADFFQTTLGAVKTE